MITHSEIIQGSPEWHDLRRGRFTASNIPKLFMGKTTQGYSDALYRVAMERVTGKSTESYSNAAMLRGIQLEPMARQIYEIKKSTIVEECGFVEVDEWIGCSPDGLVGKDGMIQIKCPAFNTHIGYLVSEEVPKDYYIQMQAEMWMSERKWNDFMSFHPDLPPLIIRLTPDEAMYKKMAEEIDIAKQRVIEIIKKIEACQR
jgi:putative phage-type endonuclease